MRFPSWIFLALTGCPDDPGGLGAGSDTSEPDSGSETDTSTADPCTCLAGLASGSLDSAAITALVDGLPACFAVDKKDLLAEQAACLPQVVGTDARNGLSIEVVYTCSDVCPDAGWLAVIYEGVAEADCATAGGVVLKDLGFGTYVGCAPPEAG